MTDPEEEEEEEEPALFLIWIDLEGFFGVDIQHGFLKS